MDQNKVEVSIIIPVYNGEKWLGDCLGSVMDQQFNGTIEVSIYNDNSTDLSVDIINAWCKSLTHTNISVVVGGHIEGGPKGVGYAKNCAVNQSHGEYLCFLDADDTMDKSRVSSQFKAAVGNPDLLVGCQVWREPPGSTERYTKWANSLSETQLYTQCFTSHGPTLLMPTWFCSRFVFDKVGGFDESGKGTPEDLIFFYSHLENKGRLLRVDGELVMYRYHPGATTFSVLEGTIWDLRIKALQERVLSKWDSFTIWNAGKQGRKLYRSLSDVNRGKVEAFCDVDIKKIDKGFYIYEDSSIRPKPRVPIVHYSKAKSPFIICMKLDLTGGNFENNLASLKLTEGIDYFHFN